ncbi:hypothetical protein QA601_17165 [Chitinispirillales bacterium ANBcel5]|uniref:hypothetical protein n=1 Tax=Cellulosispirillum alkaliphilum TaxID=3039283 RepID=UPI002A54638C|nr:hypothetical protein [Chitinispirillales bacterium ANBcel5]
MTLFQSSAFWITYFVVVTLGYIYISFAFMVIGKKAKLSHPGLAWIPGLGMFIVAFQASKMHWWPWLLLIGFLIPFVNVVALILFLVYSIIWDWKMFQAINKPGWLALLLFVPIVNFVIMGIAAWE